MTSFIPVFSVTVALCLIGVAAEASPSAYLCRDMAGPLRDQAAYAKVAEGYFKLLSHDKAAGLFSGGREAELMRELGAKKRTVIEALQAYQTQLEDTSYAMTVCARSAQ